MLHTRVVNTLLAMVLIFAPLALSQGQAGSCHPYPGAAADDCLKLIGRNLNNLNETPCVKGRATLTQDQCSIVVACAAGQTGAEVDTAVRRALTTIGRCALSDYGSISGDYVADDGTRTCYLYPSREGDCRL